MSGRYPSATVLSSMMAQESGDGVVILLEITHAAFPVPIRVASHTTDFISNGLVYTAMAFRVDLPADDPESTSTTELIIDNVDGSITAGVRSIPPGSDPPTVSMTVVTLDAPDTIEVGPLLLSISGVRVTRTEVSGTLGYARILDQVIPSGKMNPLNFPGMF